MSGVGNDGYEALIRCPACRQKYRVPSTHLGKSVRCARCRAGFLIDRVPRPGEPAATQRLLVVLGGPLPGGGAHDAEPVEPRPPQLPAQVEEPIAVESPAQPKKRVPGAIAFAQGLTDQQPAAPDGESPRDNAPPDNAFPDTRTPASVDGSPAPSNDASHDAASSAPAGQHTKPRPAAPKHVPLLDLLTRKKKPAPAVEDVTFFRGMIDLAQCNQWLIDDGVASPPPPVTPADEGSIPDAAPTRRAKRHAAIRRRAESTPAVHDAHNARSKKLPSRSDG